MGTDDNQAGVDKELRAISAILEALRGLDGDAIQRVLDYVFGRLSIPRGGRLEVATPQIEVKVAEDRQSRPDSGRVVSIRDLKEEKKPSSANQMAALVAYYLGEIAPDDEEISAINSGHIEKYFKQAGFKLPQSVGQTLPNAAAAGYFDAIGGGMYKLNPVGYNLVVHALPRQVPGKDSARPAKRRSAR